VVAFLIFFASLCGASFFAWRCQRWIVDPKRNPYAKHFSFQILLDAASWVPISVVVGKTNALVEWCMDFTQDDVEQLLLSSAVVAFLTICCAILTHVSMKHCSGVASQAQSKEAGFVGYGKFLVLTALSCLGWAVGWSLWVMVMALMDAVGGSDTALEEGQSVHSTALVVCVISLAVFCTTAFYLTWGPEPVIPDPLLQQLCYSHGYSNSVRRAFVSYLVYACMVFLVMCCADPTYGLLHVIAEQLKTQLDPGVFDKEALMVLLGICIAVTVIATLVSAAITRLTRVDMESSMKLSRSAYEVRLRLIDGKNSDAELWGYEQMMRDACSDGLDDDVIEPTSGELGGSPSCGYTSIELLDLNGLQPMRLPDRPEDRFSGGSASMDEAPEPLSRIAITRSLTASVLLYDLLAFVVCSLWGLFATRTYYIVFGYIACIHSVLYILSSVTYAFLVTIAVARGCLRLCPSATERRLYFDDKQETMEEFFVRDAVEVPLSPKNNLDPSLDTFSEPFLEAIDHLGVSPWDHDECEAIDRATLIRKILDACPRRDR